MSFQPITLQKWWAFGQFARHFLLPFAVSDQRGFKPHQIFSTFRDGIPPNVALQFLGLNRYLNRYWPLMLGSNLSPDKSEQLPSEQGKSLHTGLYGFSQFLLNGAKPGQSNSPWVDYTKIRHHYTVEASADKYQKVGEWLNNTKPKWVVDLGCNTGEYTKLAASMGANVIAVDLDHESIQKLVLSQCKANNIYPLISNLGDLAGGRGWFGDEFPSLMKRLHQQANVVMLLALTHHLAISESISFQKIAQMTFHITSEFAIVEMIDETDPMALHLCSLRQRNPNDFSLATQMAAFNEFFTIVSIYPIPNTHRTLCLLKKF
jgi:SAM-dependent methyltransferase